MIITDFILHRVKTRIEAIVPRIEPGTRFECDDETLLNEDNAQPGMMRTFGVYYRGGVSVEQYMGQEHFLVRDMDVVVVYAVPDRSANEIHRMVTADQDDIIRSLMQIATFGDPPTGEALSADDGWFEGVDIQDQDASPLIDDGQASAVMKLTFRVHYRLGV